MFAQKFSKARKGGPLLTYAYGCKYASKIKFQAL